MARFISLMGQNWPMSQEKTRLQVEEYALFFAPKASIPDLVFLFVPEKDRAAADMDPVRIPATA